MTRRFATPFWLAVDVLLLLLFAWMTGACGAVYGKIFGPFHSVERPIATSPRDSARVVAVQQCLTTWARSYFHDSTKDYAADPVTDLHVTIVDRDGVIASSGEQVDAAERGDTILISHWVAQDSPLWVALIRHEAVHIVQQRHPEVIGVGGNIHWPAPFAACSIPLAIFSS